MQTGKYLFILFSLAIGKFCEVRAQISPDTIERKFLLEEIFDLTIKNNQALQIAGSGIDIANQRIKVAEIQKLPTASISLGAGYLGNATIIDKDFSNSKTVSLPHFFNSFNLQAAQLIFKGGAVNNIIAVAELQKQVASLNYEKNKQDIKLLVAGTYLDLYRLHLQKRVYEKNIGLAQLRLKRINQLYSQGMVTKDDIIRSELQIANLTMAAVVINDNIRILNKQLTTAAGIEDNILILPDSNVLQRKPILDRLELYMKDGLMNVPDIKAAQTNTLLAEKNLNIARADRLPALSAFVGNNLQRPITTSNPALEKYSNGWQAGFTLSYNIGSLYSVPRNTKLARLQIVNAKESEVLQQQNTAIAINTAYIKNKEAYMQWQTQATSMSLADENYRIIEKRYLNQLALLIDMLDATNAKLEAELLYNNAEINILYNYYQLLRATGSL